MSHSDHYITPTERAVAQTLFVRAITQTHWATAMLELCNEVARLRIEKQQLVERLSRISNLLTKYGHNEDDLLDILQERNELCDDHQTVLDKLDRYDEAIRYLSEPGKPGIGELRAILERQV